MYNSRRKGFLSAVTPVALAALALAVPMSAGAQGCPASNALGNFTSLAGLSASYAVDGSGTTATYSFTSSDESPSGGVPGLIEYCVYADQPDTANATYGAWGTEFAQNGDYFAFKRNDGNPANVPFDGSTVVIGEATWSGGVPADQTILLHINDAAACDALYHTNPGTCFVFAGEVPPFPEQFSISGVKFYDANTDGADNGESGVAGFQITVQVLDGDHGNPVGSPIV
jgi:hypothetical protein